MAQDRGDHEVVSVVLVDWNQPEVTLDAVASVLEQRVPDAEVEVLVVDNGSPATVDGHPAAELERTRVVRLPENLGFAGGANAGIATATGDRIVLLNNDARLDPGALAELVAPLRSASHDGLRIAAVTALILLDATVVRADPGEVAELVSFDGTAWRRDVAGVAVVNSTGGEATRSANGRDRDWLVPLAALDRPRGVAPAFSGGAVALSRAALDDVGGGFDASFFMYYEDTELSWRLRRRGWSIHYAPAAVVRHRHAYSSRSDPEFLLRQNERNRLRFALLHGTIPVIAAAGARTTLRTIADLARGRHSDARRRASSLLSVARESRSLLRRRAELRRTAVVPLRSLWRDAPWG